MSTIFSLTLKPKSGWATPLQADTIFGHLCWKIKQNDDVGKLDQFLSDMGSTIDGKPVADGPFFTLSNAFPKGFIPRPILEQDFFKEPAGQKTETDEKTDKGKKDLSEKEQMSKDFDSIKDFNRKTKFIEIDKLAGYVGKFGGDNKQRILRMEELTKVAEGAPKIKDDRDLRTAINRFTSTTVENLHGPFAVPYQFLEVKDSVDNAKTKDKDNVLWVLVKVLDEKKMKDYKVEERLRQVFEEGYGKKKSVGMGQFEIAGWKERDICEAEDASHILLLSNFVPAKNDPSEGMYETFVKYGKLGEERSIAGAGNFYKKPIVMVKEGATFKISKWEKKYTGRMLNDICADPKVMHYGYGFTLRF
jgi:CRISPR-associated protein Csm4